LNPPPPPRWWSFDHEWWSSAAVIPLNRELCAVDHAGMMRLFGTLPLSLGPEQLLTLSPTAKVHGQVYYYNRRARKFTDRFTIRILLLNSSQIYF
jgi:hypothetical protein